MTKCKVSLEIERNGKNYDYKSNPTTDEANAQKSITTPIPKPITTPIVPDHLTASTIVPKPVTTVSPSGVDHTPKKISRKRKAAETHINTKKPLVVENVLGKEKKKKSHPRNV